MGYVSLVMRSMNLGIYAKGYFCWIPIQLRKWMNCIRRAMRVANLMQ